MNVACGNLVPRGISKFMCRFEVNSVRCAKKNKKSYKCKIENIISDIRPSVGINNLELFFI